jgi:NADPH-dependent ferric siderophore reductase
MASGKGILLSALGRVALTDGVVARVETLAPPLRRLQLAGPALRGASARPGDKLQVVLPSRDVRTLTPIAWDPVAGTCAIIVYVGDRGAASATPLQAWALAVAAGTAVRFLGPQRSLALPSAPSTLLIVGDETSIGVAAAAASAGHQVTALLEVTGAPALAPALAAFGLRAELVERRQGDGHHADLAARVAALAPAAALVALTGRAQTIQAVRRRGLVARVVPYWSTGKRGLD